MTFSRANDAPALTHEAWIASVRRRQGPAAVEPLRQAYRLTLLCIQQSPVIYWSSCCHHLRSLVLAQATTPTCILAPTSSHPAAMQSNGLCRLSFLHSSFLPTPPDIQPALSTNVDQMGRGARTWLSCLMVKGLSSRVTLR